MYNRKISYIHNGIPIRILYGDPSIQHWNIIKGTGLEDGTYNGSKFTERYGPKDTPRISTMMKTAEDLSDKFSKPGDFVNIFHPVFSKFYDAYEALKEKNVHKVATKEDDS